MRSFSITAFFPDVKPAHEAWQSCVAKASEIDTAAARGLADIRSRPGIKGKQIREVRLTIKQLDGAARSEESS